MTASPNYVRFVYDGDGSDTPLAGPPGSGELESVFTTYFASQGLATEPTAFDGRSDYGPFIAAGIPAGGLFSGAEGIKTAEQAAIYGGTAGAPYRPVLPPGLRHHQQHQHHGARPVRGRVRARRADAGALEVRPVRGRQPRRPQAGPREGHDGHATPSGSRAAQGASAATSRSPVRRVYAPDGSFSGLTQPRLRPASAGEAASGASSAASSSHSSPPGSR